MTARLWRAGALDLPSDYRPRFAAAELLDRGLVEPAGLQRLGLVVVLLRRPHRCMTEQRGNVVNVFRGFDGHGGRFAIAEQMRIEVFAECVARMFFDLIADRSGAHLLPALGDPQCLGGRADDAGDRLAGE